MRRLRGRGPGGNAGRAEVLDVSLLEFVGTPSPLVVLRGVVPAERFGVEDVGRDPPPVPPAVTV